MELRREAERVADAVEALLGPFGAGLEGNTQFAEHIGAARFARNRPVAVLDDRHAGRAGDKSGGRADVEGAAVVAAGAAGVQDRPGNRYEADHLFAEHLGRGGDLLRRFAFHAQGREEGGAAGLIDSPRDQIANGLGDAAGREVATA